MTDRGDTGTASRNEMEGSHVIAVRGGTRHQSRAGYWFDEVEPVWRLDKNNDVYVSKSFGYLPDEAKLGFVSTLVHYAVTKSAAHTSNIAESFYAFLRDIKPSHIDTASLINWRSTLDRETEWKLATVRVFLYKWHDLGYPGVDDDVIDLLNGWTLKGNIKGDAVKRRDPKEGPLTDNELVAFNEGVVRAFEQGKIALTELGLCLLCSHTGRRPQQLCHVRTGDLDGTKANKKGEPMYFVNIPRAKQRGDVFRDSFSAFAMTWELWAVLGAQRRIAIASVERALGYELQAPERGALPLFPDMHAFNGIASVSELRSLLETDFFHLRSSKVTAILKKVVAVAKIVSERTGEPLDIVARRFRYTKGTRAAREGFGLTVIAQLLDLTDIQNVPVYTKGGPEYGRALSMAMDEHLAPRARAFQGAVVASESDAKRGNDPTSRIKYNGQNTATCGQNGSCGANVPIPCYTCCHFQPWLDGPHEEVLADLIAERELVEQTTGDATVASVNDRTILAVIEVIQRCRIRRDELR